MYKYSYRQMEIKTLRHTQTNRQTDRQCKSTGTGWKTDRGTERPIFTNTVHTNSTVHKTDIQTDRTERKEWQTDQHTDRQTVYECSVKKKSGPNQQY